MKYIIPLAFIFALLTGCVESYSHKTGAPVPQLARMPTLDPETGKPAKWWLPDLSDEEKVDPLEARAQERRCMYGLYNDKNISGLSHPNMTHKTLPQKKNQVWAYSISYVEEREKSRGFFLRNEIIKKPASTIFNIYTDMDGKVLACTWIRGTPAYLAEQRAKAAQDADAASPAP